MKKFVVIDHSLCNLQGHHYECSIAVAEAAERKGYEPIIIANKVLNDSLAIENIKIIKAFEVDWFNQPVNIEEEKSLIPVSPKPKQPWQQRLRYQLYLWQQDYRELRILLEKVEGSTRRLKEWFKADLRSLRSIPLANTTWGLLKIVWGITRLITKIPLKITNQIITETVNTIFNKVGKPREKITVEPRSFVQTLGEVLSTLKLTSGDQVLIHTFGIEQLEELFYFLAHQNPTDLPTYHLLFRRDTEDPLVVNAKGMGLQKCLEGFCQTQLWPDKIRFYTDTADLVKKYNQLSLANFVQVPIPFRQEKLCLEDFSQNNTNYIHIVYLGDARSEKGYQHLPALIEDLWPDYLKPGLAKFTIQSNYNVTGGEATVLEAKLKLSQYPRSAVELIDHALKPDDYYRLLTSADIVVLPYNPTNYQRTSGVLTEALAAGKPVVVPQGSWLAEQVDLTRAGIYSSPSNLPISVRYVLENLANLTKKAEEFSHHWRSCQSPDYFLECLLRQPVIVPGKTVQIKSENLTIASILIVISLDKLLDRRNVNIIRHFCRCGYEVYGIFYRQPEHSSSPEDVYLFDNLQQLGLKQHWILQDYYTADNFYINFAKNSTHLSPEQCEQYLRDYYHHQSTLITNWVQSAGLIIPPELQNNIQGNIDLIYVDSFFCQHHLKKLGLDLAKTILAVDKFYAYDDALRQKREVIYQDLQWEINQLKLFSVLLTTLESLAFKLQELQPQAEVYSLRTTDQGIDYDQLNQAITYLLGEKVLIAPKSKNVVKKVVMLYPWGDIEERCSGASQRSGRVADFLASEGLDVTVLSVGDRQSNWHGQVHYRYFKSGFPQGELVQKVYQEAFLSWQKMLNISLSDNSNSSTLSRQQLTENWLPWIYYSSRFDARFQEILERVIDGADAVLLEYPFWAAIAGPICRNRGVKLILTAHDVLAKQLPTDSWLAQIALAEELQALQEADEVVTLSPEDQAFFRSYNIGSHYVPIGLDVASYPTSADPEPTQAILESLDTAINWRQPFCLFVGSQHLPNVKAVEQIQTLAQAGGGHWQAIAVGGCCPSKQERNFFALGKVSDSVLQALYRRAALVLIPLETGTGMSVKTLEAMAYGKVILGTAIAFRGYPVESEVHCLINNNLATYIGVIEDIIQHPHRYEQLGNSARNFAQNYDHRQLYQTYLDLLS
ncbi:MULTISPECIES: glycosyltransferase [unclassified Synechocystis]|uniref:glycosyltransferase n=1 Tax=unclassified Synechocystis TaxID=2640012 RepID=UPI00048DA1EE|nr:MULTISPECIES: glycosyltransferase [unclassified Synechocystis]MCT0252353.1 glycosyltransferase [Synechocystis sp. CS-94]